MRHPMKKNNYGDVQRKNVAAKTDWVKFKGTLTIWLIQKAKIKQTSVIFFTN